jgi:uncharacterized protein YbdZ (MbtH family)
MSVVDRYSCTPANMARGTNFRKTRHLVLVNEEEQYSIWRGGVPIPAGGLSDSGSLDVFRSEAAAGNP